MPLQGRGGLKLIYTVNIRLHAGSDDVGVGTEAVVELVVVLYLHVHLTHIVRALADGLDGEFLEGHVALDDLLQCADGGIYGTVTCATERTPTPLVTCR